MKRWVIAVVAPLLVAAGVVIFWPKEPKESIGQSVTFSDGTTMTLNDVTYGTEHHYLGGWKARMVSVLPAKWRKKFRVGQGTFNVGRPSIVFWFARRGNGPTTGDPQLVLCDGSGYGVSGGYSMMRMGMPGNWVEGWAFSHFPRRERTFTLRVYEPGKRYPDAKLLGEFTARNPRPAKYPVWTAPAPPLTASNGDLSITLVDVTAGVGRGANKWKPARNPTVTIARVGYRVQRNGQPTREWEVKSVEATDATGNLIQDLWGTSFESEPEYAELQPHLWPAEGVWKLHMGFTQRSNFVASELWTIRGATLGATDAANKVATETNLQGATLKYAGKTVEAGADNVHQFKFRITPGRPDYRLTLVKAIDDKGRPAKEVSSYEGSQDWHFSLQANTNATSLDLTLALHQTRYFDFLVRPQLISTNAPKQSP